MNTISESPDQEGETQGAIIPTSTIDSNEGMLVIQCDTKETAERVYSALIEQLRTDENKKTVELSNTLGGIEPYRKVISPETPQGVTFVALSIDTLYDPAADDPKRSLARNVAANSQPPRDSGALRGNALTMTNIVNNGGRFIIVADHDFLQLTREVFEPGNMLSHTTIHVLT